MSTNPPALPLNDDSDYGLCFACGPRNEGGLQLTFERQGNRIVTAYQGKAHHQGFPGYLHGAVITALLDEVMSRVPVLENRWGISARLDIRFRLQIKSDEQVTATAEKDSRRGSIVNTKGWIELADGRVAAEATGSYVLLSQDTLDEMAQGFPGLARSWRVGNGGG